MVAAICVSDWCRARNVGVSKHIAKVVRVYMKRLGAAATVSRRCRLFVPKP
jgi:hypothetical protein